MQFSKLIALTLPALAFATPALEARQNDPQASVFIEKYLSSANTAVEDLTVFGCDVKACVIALGPTIAACGAAAALEGKDKAKDASCFANAFKDEPSNKPAGCEHCY